MDSTLRSITHKQVTMGNFCNICIIFVLLLSSFLVLWTCCFDVSFVIVADVK
jgi:hypothetical protein